MGIGKFLQQMVLGKLNINMKKKKEPLAYTYTKIDKRWTEDISVRPQTIKLLEEKIRYKFPDIDFARIFLDMTSKHR